jgi:hypothetical protein
VIVVANGRINLHVIWFSRGQVEVWDFRSLEMEYMTRGKKRTSVHPPPLSNYPHFYSTTRQYEPRTTRRESKLIDYRCVGHAIPIPRSPQACPQDRGTQLARHRGWNQHSCRKRWHHDAGWSCTCRRVVYCRKGASHHGARLEEKACAPDNRRLGRQIRSPRRAPFPTWRSRFAGYPAAGDCCSSPPSPRDL